MSLTKDQISELHSRLASVVTAEIAKTNADANLGHAKSKLESFLYDLEIKTEVTKPWVDPAARVPAERDEWKAVLVEPVELPAVNKPTFYPKK